MADLLPAALPPDTLILTAGERLARHLLGEHARAQLAAGRQAWPTPSIFPWQVWLERRWQELLEIGAVAGQLLNDTQEFSLWERIVRERDRGDTLLLPSAAARSAAEAWLLAHAWRLPFAQFREPLSDDAAMFREWAREFEARCVVQGWVSRATLADRVREALASSSVEAPGHVVLAGFDELTPQQQDFASALTARGSEVMQFSLPLTGGEARRCALRTAEDEAAIAAQWARARLAQNPAARIAIVVPDLAARRALLARTLEDALMPEVALPGNGEPVRPFNFSLGLPLAEYPLVAAALRILELGDALIAERRLPVGLVGGLLRSPFIAEAGEEIGQRALLDARLHEAREPFVTAAWLVQQASRQDESGGALPFAAPLLAARLARWREQLAALPRRQPAGRWAAAFAQLLETLGWPGDRALTSSEYQVLEAWRERLAAFVTLETVSPVMDYGDARRALQRMSEERLFQPRTPEVPVQVLGVLEASGLTFDHVWVMGLHDEVWPMPANPHPLLPLTLQRRLNVAHATAQRELDFARQVTKRLIGSGGEVVASHPIREGDRVLRPSPLIAALSAIECDDLVPAPSARYRDVVHATAAREEFSDRWLPLSGTTAPGGTALIERQSACPFRAFAEFRLDARALAETEAGLGAAERGILLHRVLDAAWKECGTHERLLALGGEGRAQLAARAAGQEVAVLARRRPFTMSEAVAILERERLATLVAQWLEFECGRAPFRVALAEAHRRLVVGGLELDARMDRVDVLEDGSLVVLDYKSGEARVSEWFGERPRAPQLPLYAACGFDSENVAAVAFARVRRDAHDLAGLAREADLLAGVEYWQQSKQVDAAGSWAELLARWRDILARLAQEYRAGVAAVTPRDRTSCQHCPLTTLCRVHEVNERAGRLVLEDADE